MKIRFQEKDHTYWLGKKQIPGVSEILQTGGFINYNHVNQHVLERSQKFGKAVHRACELDDRGDLEEKPLSPPLIPYLQAWRKFKVDFKVKIIVNEFIVYSAKWGYAGTLDRVLRIGRKNILPDLKSPNVMQPFTRLQTAAYKIAYEEQTKLKISERWGLQLKGNGFYNIEPYAEKSDKFVFTGAVGGYYFKKEVGLI